MIAQNEQMQQDVIDGLKYLFTLFKNRYHIGQFIDGGKY